MYARNKGVDEVVLKRYRNFSPVLMLKCWEIIIILVAANDIPFNLILFICYRKQQTEFDNIFPTSEKNNKKKWIFSGMKGVAFKHHTHTLVDVTTIIKS